MGIINLTHTQNGEVIQRLPVAIKVAIGLGPTEQRNHPVKLDHFVLLRKGTQGKDIRWEPDAELAKLYGEKPTEIGIILLDDEPDNVFRTSYAWWTSTECRCRGELVQISNGGNPRYEMRATRRTPKHPDGEVWPGPYKYADGPKKGQPVEPCGDGCPDLERGDCKPSGDLTFILDKLPMLGAVCRLHTTSYRSVRQIHAGLQQIRTVTGGRLAGIRAMLKVRPEKIAYEDKDAKKKTTTVWVLSLEISAQDMEKLLANMTETAKLFEQTRKLLGGRRIEVTEDEFERAPEIAAEFHPVETEEQRALPEKAQIPNPEEVAQQQRVRELCAQLGQNEAKANMLIGQRAGQLSQVITELEKQVEMFNFLPDGEEPSEASPTPATTADASTPTGKPEGKPTGRGRAASPTPQKRSTAASAPALDW